MSNTTLLPRIETRIQMVRGLKVIIDADLADLHGVSTRRLNEQVKRNRDRFPADFMFVLDATEKAEVVANCDHLRKLKFSRTLPHAFTPDPPRRPIGFVAPQEKKAPKAGKQDRPPGAADASPRRA